MAESTTDSNWHLWCRLCAKDDVQNNVNVFLKKEQSVNDGSKTPDVTLTTAIGKYFWVNITRGEELPEMICTECLNLVTSLVNFSERITRVQKLYCILQSMQQHSELKPINLQELRSKFGLLNEQRETETLLTEVHYVDEKPRLNEHGLLDEQNPLTPCVRNEDYEDFGNDEEEEEVQEGAQDSNVAPNEDSVNDGETLLELCHVLGAAEDAETSSEKSSTSADRNNRKTSTTKDESNQTESPKTNKSLTCPECSRVYALATTLKRHMRQEHNKLSMPALLTCSECDKKFRTSHQQKRHMKQHAPMPKRKVFPCASCDKKFTTNFSARQHVQYMHKNTRPRPFICEQCGVGVHSNAALKEHMLRHTDETPFECEICKKCFKSSSRLKHHQETHDPHKYICPECGMQLNSRPTLNRHRLVHTDQMQHKCDYCGREFKRAKALKNHLILHTGLKPYSCDFCDRTFANGSNCRTHKKKAHPEELAALEAAGVAKVHNRNIPKLAALKAFTKNKDNLSPVATKQSGCFAFGKKPKVVKKTEPVTVTTPSVESIPTIDNIYSHIMKQTPPTPTSPSAKVEEATYAVQPQQLLITTNTDSASGPIIHIEVQPSNATTQVFTY